MMWKLLSSLGASIYLYPFCLISLRARGRWFYGYRKSYMSTRLSGVCSVFFPVKGQFLTYEMVTGEHPGQDEESPPADEITLLKAVTQESFFVDFLRTDEHDEDGVRGSSLLELPDTERVAVQI